MPPVRVSVRTHYYYSGELFVVSEEDSETEEFWEQPRLSVEWVAFEGGSVILNIYDREEALALAAALTEAAERIWKEDA